MCVWADLVSTRLREHACRGGPCVRPNQEVDMFATLWIASIIATLYIADQKKLGLVGYFFLSLFTGPLAFMIVLLVSSRASQPDLNNYNVPSLDDARRQLRDLQTSLWAQEEKIKQLEILINKLSGPTAEAPLVKVFVPDAKPAAEVLPSRPIALQDSPVPIKRPDMELDFGRNWLSKIGIAVLALGVAFLISYSFKYFGPFLKIAFGYMVAGGIFYAGIKLEAQEKLKNYGRALLGGAWAITYFTTYAMYHFEASRIISNEFIDLILLSLVVLGMMAHTLRYKSEGMMAVAIFVAYLTSTIGAITSFTVLSTLLLACLILVLVYRFQWVRILSLGIVMTYGIHYVWILPRLFATPINTLFDMDPIHYHDAMNFIFLTSYWLVYFTGVHLIRSLKDNDLARSLASTNFANVALYSLLSYPLVLRLFYTQRFIIVLGEGLIYLIAALMMKKTRQEKMYLSDIIAAVFGITFALSLKFLPTSTLLLWLIEIPSLLFVGITFKERIFNYFSYALAVVVAFRLIFLGTLGFMPDIIFLGHHFTWLGFMSFWVCLSMARCFNLTQGFKKDPQCDPIDLGFDQIFSLAACFYLSQCLWSMVHQPWCAFALALEGWFFLAIGRWLGLRRFRAYAYVAFGFSACVFLGEHIHAANGFFKWFIVSVDALSILAVYYSVKYLKHSSPSDLFFEYEEEMAFAVGLLLLIIAIHQYVFFQWISLSLGIASVVLILTGFISGHKIERLGGMALLALTLGRVVLIDLSGLDIIFKIITLIVLGLLFLGVSYIYNRFNMGKG